VSTITQRPRPAPAPNRDIHRLYRMTIDQYEALVASGAFAKRDRFQLINGLLVEKMTKNPPHAVVKVACHDALDRIIPKPKWHVRDETPVRLPPDCEPEPDITVVRGANFDYSKHHPGPADVGLWVEVADTSLAEDRKMWATYRALGVKTYWIVNIPDRQIEVYTGPGRARVFKAGKSVPVVLDGLEVGRVDVNEILPE
jgi:Uma2 family endonuclease